MLCGGQGNATHVPLDSLNGIIQTPLLGADEVRFDLCFYFVHRVATERVAGDDRTVQASHPAKVGYVVGSPTRFKICYYGAPGGGWDLSKLDRA